MEQICVAWMSLKRVALKIYFSIKGANDILCCDPESSFFNAVFRADINDLWERLLTLLLMKLNDGMYAGRETSISFCMILRSLIITSFPMSLDSLTFLNQKSSIVEPHRLQRTLILNTACVRDDLKRVRKKNLIYFRCAIRLFYIVLACRAVVYIGKILWALWKARKIDQRASIEM